MKDCADGDPIWNHGAGSRVESDAGAHFAQGIYPGNAPASFIGPSRFDPVRNLH